MYVCIKMPTFFIFILSFLMKIILILIYYYFIDGPITEACYKRKNQLCEWGGPPLIN
jgi:hypothetical protein